MLNKAWLKKSLWSKAAVLLCLAGTVWGGTFGKVVSIGGHAADLALDEGRGVLYIANFTANRIDVMSLANNSIQTSINVPPQPSSLALSPDGRFLVITHYGNFAPPIAPANAVTLIDLTNSAKRTFALANPPLGVAFGADGLALIVTSTDFILFEPVSGTTTEIDTVAGVIARTLPVPSANFPPQITAASLAVSGDGTKMYGLTDKLQIAYDVTARAISIVGYVSTPVQGPRVVSVNQDGSLYTSGWTLNDSQGNLVSEFPGPSGALNIGSHAIDSSRGLIYAQIPDQALPATQPPILQVVDSDNLTVHQRLKLAENLAGKSVISSDASVMYSISDSGVTVFQIGALQKTPRVTATKEDLVFRGNFCDRQTTTQDLSIVDPGGGNTAFSISSDTNGVTVKPSSGVTPAVVHVTVDPNPFQNQRGTVTASLTISSSQAANIPSPVRVLVNTPEPDQRGISLDVPGTLVDLLADPTRDRFFVIRQDQNQVLVYDGTNYNQIAVLRTLNVPTQLAITYDQRWLLVGHNDAQFISVFDLETLETSTPIQMPGGHYPRSVAASANAILVANRVAGPVHTIDRVDMVSRTATQLPSLGVYNNSISPDSMLVAAPSGRSIFAVEADGNVLLYDASVDSFTISRKDFTALSGAYAASLFDQYVVGGNMLDSSLVPVSQFDTSTGAPSGFAFVDQMAFRTTVPVAAGTGGTFSSAAGIIQRIDPNNIGTGTSLATRIVEAPLLSRVGYSFTRTLAPLFSRNNIINLTVSGFTVLPWYYDAAVAPPHIDAVVNAADGSSGLAPGGLISIYGEQLSPLTLVTMEIPVSTALGGSCLTVNGLAVPILFVSPAQINAQMPFETLGNVTMILHTPGGVSDNFNLVVLPGAPGVFRSGTAGPESGIATIVRAKNGELVTGSNPVHKGDTLVIYLTGLGATNPPTGDGLPGPSSPLASTQTKPQVTLGGVALGLIYSGLAPGEVGVYQINVTVPAKGVPTGNSIPLVISQAGGTTSLSVRVVD